MFRRRRQPRRWPSAKPLSTWQRRVSASRSSPSAVYLVALSQNINSSESEPQRHLNLPRTADGLVGYAQSGGRIVEAAVRDVATICRQWRCSNHRKLIVELVLRNIVDGNVEARGIRQVENVQAVFQRVTLGELSNFDEGNVSALLPCLPEDVALSSCKVGLERVIRRNGSAQIARI